MLSREEVARIASVADLLDGLGAPDRLHHLKHLCVHNDGVWAVPENPDGYKPVLYEVQLFGIPALAYTPDELPANWLRAAHNVLEALVDAA